MKVGRFMQFLFSQPQVEHTQRTLPEFIQKGESVLAAADSVQKIMMGFARSTLFSKLFLTPAELNFLCACCRFFPAEYTKTLLTLWLLVRRCTTSRLVCYRPHMRGFPSHSLAVQPPSKAEPRMKPKPSSR